MPKNSGSVNDQVAWKGRPKRGGRFAAPSIVDEDSLSNDDWKTGLADATIEPMSTNKNSRGRAHKPAAMPKGR